MYQLHDGVSDFLAKHLFGMKRTLLVVAHLSLLGFFFPEFRKSFGELAANLLIFILFISPLSKIFRMRLLLLLMSLRRELGIMMGYLATVHGVGYLIDPDWFDFIVAPMLVGNIWGEDPRYVFGLLAYALTLPLLLTSNALIQRYMGTKWKLLHRTVYLMFAFAIIHRFLIKGAPTLVIFEITLLLGSYVLAKVLAWKNFLPPFVTAIRLVAEDYRRFKSPAVLVAPVPPPPSVPSA
jgi:DMSO/TMAO reductase YedYZ heme-binding membrane subunit